MNALTNLNKELLDNLQEGARTSDVKNLQMLQLQKVIMAVGMFSIFDSELQRNLSCNNGFRRAREILKSKGEIELEIQFENYILAINVLKHGQGKSYQNLLQKDYLPFEMVTPTSTFYEEGDISEIDSLIKVDDLFIKNCANLISRISNSILN